MNNVNKDIESIRKHFPILKKRKFIYFDNAATTQKPLCVINAMEAFIKNSYANVHRGFYKEAIEATMLYEKAREIIAKFINAKPEQIVFTKNATEAINLVAYSLKGKYKKACATIAEHHSNFVPWQQLYHFSVMKIDKIGNPLFNVKKQDIYAFHHVSNVIGHVCNLNEIEDFTKEQNALCIIDATQSLQHLKIDVKKCDIDFLVFSGHKILGPTGIGVLYMKEPLEKPFIYGGEMIKSVFEKQTYFKESPYRFEAGTPPIIEAIGLAEAIKFIESIGFEKIKKIEKRLVEKMHDNFNKRNIKYIGFSDELKNKIPLFSFNLNLHCHDVAALFANKSIAIRAGNHCAQPLHRFLGHEAGSARASLYIYNNEQEIETFFHVMDQIIKIGKR